MHADKVLVTDCKAVAGRRSRRRKDQMKDALLEIVMLETGEIVVRRSSEQDEPLLTLSFSDELSSKLGDERINIAKIMLSAGVQLVAEAGARQREAEADVLRPPVIH
jgi:hypothetical protein